jgi:predicted kinase
MTPGELPGCVIVTGMPGAGKTTVTALAARLLPRAAQVKGDTVSYMVLSGRVGFQDEPADEAVRQGELVNRNLTALANNFIDFGFTVLMDTVVPGRVKLDRLVGLLRPRPVRLVILAPGIEACRYRNSIRDPEERFDFDGYERLEADMRRDLDQLGWWFDTSALTPADTAAQLVAEAPSRAPLLSLRAITGERPPLEIN